MNVKTYLNFELKTPKKMTTRETKVQAMLNIAPPTSRRQLRSFIGIIIKYRDMWIRRNDVIAALSKLLSKDITEVSSVNLLVFHLVVEFK